MKNLILILCILTVAAAGCERPVADSFSVEGKSKEVSAVEPVVEAGGGGGAELRFDIVLNRKTYMRSDYGDPPQFAIWLEDESGELVETVFVTYRMASGDWVGKVDCSVGLPYWVSRYNKVSGTSGPPLFLNPLPLALTGATPREEFSICARVPVGSQWRYFIEVNVSGDYNADYPAMCEDGSPDPQGNGQPSLVYSGSITAADGASDEPGIIGRTEQFYVVSELNSDLSRITSADKLFDRVSVRCEVGSEK